ncbi:MAG: DUF933 domain-containing protein [Patescibacteria group bacterium]
MELELANIKKPTLYVLNTSAVAENVKIDFADFFLKLPGPHIEVDPIFGAGLDNLIKASYDLLNLITFFTTGEDESRAWTTRRDSTAPVAGRAIHNDFKEKFIRAEVINWKDLLDYGSYAVARSKGLVRTEGKEYIVKDGDVIEFLI